MSLKFYFLVFFIAYSGIATSFEEVLIGPYTQSHTIKKCSSISSLSSKGTDYLYIDFSSYTWGYNPSINGTFYLNKNGTYSLVTNPDLASEFINNLMSYACNTDGYIVSSTPMVFKLKFNKYGSKYKIKSRFTYSWYNYTNGLIFKGTSKYESNGDVQLLILQ
jgi:hypothetical protein